MKKFFAFLVAASMISLVACGPSEEEKKKMEEEANAAVEQMFQELEQSVEESTEAAEATDSTDSTATEAPATN